MFHDETNRIIIVRVEEITPFIPGLDWKYFIDAFVHIFPERVVFYQGRDGQLLETESLISKCSSFIYVY